MSENQMREDLIKVEANLINSFRLLQDTLNRNLEEVHLKTSTMEDRIMDILHSKERVILRLNTSIEGLTRNLAIVEESVSSLSSRADWYSSMETHVNLRLERFAREHLQRMDQLQGELIKMENKIKIDLEDKVNESHLAPVKNKLESLQARLGDSKPISNYHSNQEMSSIRQQLKDLNRLISRIIEDTTKQERKIKIMEDNSYRSSPQKDVTEKKRDQRAGIPKYSSDNGPLNEVQASQEPVETMEVGLRALRKSKQKRQAIQQQGTLSQRPNLLLSPNAATKKKDLPPLGKDSRQRGKKNITPAQQLQQSAEFFVGQDGYIIDRQGNYVRDQRGNLIEYSPDDMEDMEDQDY